MVLEGIDYEENEIRNSKEIRQISKNLYKDINAFCTISSKLEKKDCLSLDKIIYTRIHKEALYGIHSELKHYEKCNYCQNQRKYFGNISFLIWSESLFYLDKFSSYTYIKDVGSGVKNFEVNPNEPELIIENYKEKYNSIKYGSLLRFFDNNFKDPLRSIGMFMEFSLQKIGRSKKIEAKNYKKFRSDINKLNEILWLFY